MTAAERIAEYDPGLRYRLYRAVANDGTLDWIAGAGAPDAGGLGQLIVTQHADGENLDGMGGLGILDTDAWKVGEPGVWLSAPFHGFISRRGAWTMGVTS